MSSALDTLTMGEWYYLLFEQGVQKNTVPLLDSLFEEKEKHY